VHSSTSSFDREIPKGPWGLTIVVAALAAVAILAGAELAARHQGHAPSVPDSLDLWSYHRGRVYEDGGKSVVLLGESRMQTGFSPEAFRERYSDYRLTQLAVSGTSPMATLKDLANDERFVGTVICSMAAVGLLPPVERAHSQREYVAHYRRGQTRWDIGERLRLQLLCEHFTIAGAQFRLRPLLNRCVMGTDAPPPEFLTTRFDRSQMLDFRKVDVERQRNSRVLAIHQFFDAFVPATPNFEEWVAEAQALKPALEKLRLRGGQVVFVRFPETGEFWQLSEAHFPKQRFWDHLSELTGAATIHFKDVPGLANFECPDDSHLDFRDAYAFTHALLDECVRLKILPDSDSPF